MSAYTCAKPITVATMAMRPKSERDRRRVRTASWTMPTTVVVTMDTDVHLTPWTALLRRDRRSGSAIAAPCSHGAARDRRTPPGRRLDRRTRRRRRRSLRAPPNDALRRDRRLDQGRSAPSRADCDRTPSQSMSLPTKARLDQPHAPLAPRGVSPHETSRKPSPTLEGPRPASHRRARGDSPAGRTQAPRRDPASDCLDSLSVPEADRYSRGLLQSRADIVSSHAKPSLRKRPAVSGVADRNATRRRRRSHSHAFVDDPRGARYPRGRDARRRPGVTLVRGSVRMPDKNDRR